MRMIESMLNVQRPPGITAKQAAEDIQKKTPALFESFARGAYAVTQYFVEQAKSHHWYN